VAPEEICWKRVAQVKTRHRIEIVEHIPKRRVARSRVWVKEIDVNPEQADERISGGGSQDDLIIARGIVKDNGHLHYIDGSSLISDGISVGKG
jgi:hypothetical protein